MVTMVVKLQNNKKALKMLKKVVNLAIDLRLYSKSSETLFDDQTWI